MPTLNWIGKEKVINHYQDVPFRVLGQQYMYSLMRGVCKINLGNKDSGCLDLSRAGELGSENAYEFIADLCN